MNLNEIAEQDLEFTLEDTDSGFGVDLIFYDSESNEVEISCSTTDISYFIDPQTGAGVSSRQVEISCRIKTMTDNDVTPAVNDEVLYIDTIGVEFKSCIKQIMPDRKLGIYKLILEAKE